MKKIKQRIWEIELSPNTIETKQHLVRMLETRADAFSPEDVFAIIKAIQDGDLTKAQFMVAKASKAFSEARHQQQMELQSAQPQAQAQAEQAIAGAKAQLIQVEYAEKTKLSMAEHQMRMAEVQKQSIAQNVQQKVQ